MIKLSLWYSVRLMAERDASAGIAFPPRQQDDSRRHQVDRAGNVDGQAHANIAAHKNESG
jgi:hypothetical protein